MPFSISPKWLVVGAILIAGMGYSVYDYSAWRKTEFNNYGQGAQDANQVQPALSLDKWYQNDELEFRIAYPSTWDIQISETNPLVVMGDGQAKTVVTATPSSVGVIDEVNKIAPNLPPLLYDREYITRDTLHIIILTWEEGGNTVQRAYTQNTGHSIVFESVVPTSSWKLYAKTLWAIYESMIVF